MTCLLVLLLVSSNGASLSAAEGPADANPKSAERNATADKKEGTMKPRPRVTISKETTLITEPLLPNGYPDYVGALNKTASEGVTTQNNGAIVLLEMLGWKAIQAENKELDQDEFCRQLGIAKIPKADVVYQSWSEFAKTVPLDQLPKLTAKNLEFDVEEGANLDGEEFRQTREYKPLEVCNIRPWTTKQYPAFARWLETQRPVLAKLAGLKTRDRYYCPRFPSKFGALEISIDDPILTISRVRELVLYALVPLAMWDIGEGRLDAAVEDLELASLLLRCTEERPLLVDRIIHATLVNAAQPVLREIIFHPAVTDAQLQRVAELGQRTRFSKSLANIYDQGERYFALSVVCQMAENGCDGEGNPGKLPVALRQWLWDYDQLLRSTNEFQNRVVKAQSIADRKSRQAALAEIGKLQVPGSIFSGGEVPPTTWQDIIRTVLKSLTRAGRTELLAERHIGLSAGAIPPADKIEARQAARYEVDLLGIALARYRLAHARFPEKLDALVPKYVKAIPPDPCTVQPLVYKTDGKNMLLYSVGPDGKDHGGFYGFVGEPTKEEYIDDQAIYTAGWTPPEPRTDGKSKQ
ncbi:MAG: hypothetical protein SGJ20_07905 [Planctomycetota bacterium]|nr:hypothetical protein [Planctomycetota bacterium]